MPTSSTPVLGMVAGLLIGIGILVNVLTIQSAERRLCQIQQRGAQARPYLIGSLDDIHKLLAIPVPKAQQRREPAETRHIVASLNKNLTSYVTLAQQAPSPNKCP